MTHEQRLEWRGERRTKSVSEAGGEELVCRVEVLEEKCQVCLTIRMNEWKEKKKGGGSR